MNRHQMERLYEANGCGSYKLETLEDLLKIHGIDYKALPGYSSLSDEHKEYFQVFILAYMNGLGLDARMNFYPTGIHYVEQTCYYQLVKEDDDEYYDEIGRDIYDLNNDEMYKHYRDEDYDSAKVDKSAKEKMLRVDYEDQGYDKESRYFEQWLHVIEGGTQWY